MTPTQGPIPLGLFAHPYQEVRPLSGGKQQLRQEGRLPGSVLVWDLSRGVHGQDADIVRARPGGLPLIVLLPEPSALPRDPAFLRLIESARPLGVLPAHGVPHPDDLAAVLRQPPEDLAAEVTDYLVWRGIPLDRETARLIRRTLALSAELRSITALSRTLYLSRRALGRRFLSRGLPVPSHWLHFGRILRVAIRLQTSDDGILSVGYELGYPDGFSLSNQMVRLTGYRPVEVRQYLGWEWLLEAWLRREADMGSLAPELTHEFLSDPAPRRPRVPAMRHRTELRAGAGTEAVG